MTRGRAGSHRDDRVGELDREDPPRIYSHPQHHRITLATSTRQSPLAGENEINKWVEIGTLPTHTNCSHPDTRGTGWEGWNHTYRERKDY